MENVPSECSEFYHECICQLMYLEKTGEKKWLCFSDGTLSKFIQIAFKVLNFIFMICFSNFGIKYQIYGI